MNTEWQTTGVPGLYRRSSGTYYSRYSVAGRRTFRSLSTETWSVARLRHAQRTGIIEQARQQGAELSPDLHNLGSLARALEVEIQNGTASTVTKANYQIAIARLRAAWQQGDFDTTQARSVSRDTIAALREYLLHKAPRIQSPERLGYAPASVNQALNALRLMLDIAVKRHVILANPFRERGAIRQPIMAAVATRRPEIPDNATVERIFSEMGRVPEGYGADEALLVQFRAAARASEIHARFLAYSGLRLAEAQAARWEDVRGDWLHVRGTKTASSSRTIPIIPALRRLLDQIRGEAQSGPILQTKTSIGALQRACERLGLAPLRHHDLRHFFATACIESGVDIPTVADWLGHADGGVLLMQTYRHLRQQHSAAAARTVSVGVTPPALPASAG